MWQFRKCKDHFLIKILNDFTRIYLCVLSQKLTFFAKKQCRLVKSQTNFCTKVYLNLEEIQLYDIIDLCDLKDLEMAKWCAKSIYLYDLKIRAHQKTEVLKSSVKASFSKKRFTKALSNNGSLFVEGIA